MSFWNDNTKKPPTKQMKNDLSKSRHLQHNNENQNVRLISQTLHTFQYPHDSHPHNKAENYLKHVILKKKDMLIISKPVLKTKVYKSKSILYASDISINKNHRKLVSLPQTLTSQPTRSKKEINSTINIFLSSLSIRSQEPDEIY